MENFRDLVRPSKSEWIGVPRRKSGSRIVLTAWLTGVVTIGLAFIVDRGWDEPALTWEESLLPTKVFTAAAGACTVAFALLGWALGRACAFGLVIVLAACAWLHGSAGAASVPVWATEALVAVVLAAAEAWASSRQLKAVQQLAARLKDGSAVRVGANALSSERRALMQGRWITAGLVAVSVVLWGWFSVQWSIAGNQAPPPDGNFFEPVVAQFAAVATVLTVVSAGRNVWRWWAHRQARLTVWIVPGAGGPVWAPGLDPAYGDGIDPKDSETQGCSCLAEAQSRDIDGEEDWSSGTIPADDYCPVHGIDAINALDHDTFRALARAAWLWDKSSMVPSTGSDAPDTAAGLLAFAGHTFGGIPVRRNGDLMDATSPRVEAAEELKTTDAVVPEWAEPEFLPPPERGILDIVDLTPADLPGTATRYRHGRAWHDPNPTPTDKTMP
ncbi:hypothetical protein [Arthrobacter sp. NPDC056493]|uniref:hypothetical protein n=1 Tax=Arthrobacter sp. NPDC056493 TaxID=3345839 RepID=UPI00366AE9D9